MHHRNHLPWTTALVTLFAVGCTLDAVEVGGGFRGADEEGAESGDESGAAESSGDLPADEPPADEPPADEPPADDPPADEPPADEPAELDAGGLLHAALADCAFNLVWTTGPHYNNGTGLTKDLVAAQDDKGIAFQPSDFNAWVFPAVTGTSVFSLEILAIDDDGVYTIGGQVVGPQAVLTLPPLQLDPGAPIVLEDATVQVPGSVGPAILTSLVDDSQQLDESFRWGLVVSLNGGPNPACDPLLESVYGPF